MYDHLNKLGEWEYSPDGKDSVWNQTIATHNLNLIEDVLKDYESTERKWDSLYFLSKKYDSIPFPSELVLDNYKRKIESKIRILNWKISLEKLVKRGMYDRNGNKLKEF